MVHQDAGAEERALEEMIAVVRRFPKHAGALNFVGFTWAEQGVRLSEAEDYIRRALEVEPEDAAIIDSLGWVLFKRGDLDGAERHLRRALERMPDEGELHYHLGEVLWAKGDRTAALAAFEKAVALTDPAVPGAAAYRARFEKRLAAVRRALPKARRPKKPR
jgi:Tfp pilus assembly protein PilF